MKTLLNRLTNIFLTITMTFLTLVVVAGNLYLAVINYRLQQTKGLFDKLRVMNDIPFDHPESLALTVHILTLILSLCAVIWFLSIRFSKAKFNLFKS